MDLFSLLGIPREKVDKLKRLIAWEVPTKTYEMKRLETKVNWLMLQAPKGKEELEKIDRYFSPIIEKARNEFSETWK